MIPASQSEQRPHDARLLLIDACGGLVHASRTTIAERLHPGDLVIANDAATMPASLQGTHRPTGAPIEVRLAQRASLAPEAVHHFVAIVFGAGDWRTPTERRPPPPPLAAGDALALGPLTAIVERVLDHPRLVALRFEGSPATIWSGLARHGRPIQYAHVPGPLALWDVWTPLAGPPVAFEPPSAGFAVDWNLLGALRRRGIAFATLTHAAGISSTGDDALDRRLPLDEPYRIPEATAAALRRMKTIGGRVVAIGTTVVRALEHAARRDGQVRGAEGIADQRIGVATRLRVVDAILSGTHEPDTSHYQLLRAFADDATLRAASIELDARAYRTHEFGDSVFLERKASAAVCAARRAARA